MMLWDLCQVTCPVGCQLLFYQGFSVYFIFSWYNVLSNIPNHFTFLLNLISFCQIFCQSNWTLFLVKIFSNLILLPLESMADWFPVTYNSCLKSRVFWYYRISLFGITKFLPKFFLNVFWYFTNLSVFLQFVTVVQFSNSFSKVIDFIFYVCYPFLGIIVFGQWLVFSFKSLLCSLVVTASYLIC